MKRILVLCDQGNNRSVTLAGQLKYLGYDVLTAGVNTNAPSTVGMLQDWSDYVILTEKIQGARIIPSSKVLLWDLGPDTYPRPYNPELLTLVKQAIKEHRHELEE